MNVAVLKGYVYGVKWNTQKHQAIIAHALEQLKGYSAIAWDGDLLKDDSYTRVLFHIMTIYPKKRYIAFKKSKSAKKLGTGHVENDHGVRASGFPKVTEQGIEIVTLNDNIGWQNMGLKGVQLLQKRFNKVDIFFFGQGYVAKSEENRIMKAKALFPNVHVKQKYNVIRNVPK